MHIKLILAHILIFIISIFGFGYFYEFIGNGPLEIIYAIFHLTIVLTLYFVSGFLTTDKTKKFDFKNYFIVALIGFVIWFFAVLDSPTDLDWKKGNGGVLWLIYRIYIGGIETPFNFNDSFSILTKSAKINVGLLLVLTIIPSILQTYGGFLRIKRNKNTPQNPLASKNET